MPFILRHVRQQIQGDGEFQVGRIEIDQVVGAPAGNVVQQFLGQVAVRVNQADTVPERDVLDNHVPQQGCLSRTRFTDDVNVLPQIRQGNPEGNLLSPVLAHTDKMVSWFMVAEFNRHSRPC